MKQILVSAAVCVITIAIHALVMSTVVKVAKEVDRRTKSLPFLALSAIMSATVLVLMGAHTLEVIVWALTYWIVGAAPPDTDLAYFAFVNYATLGYGDITPLPEWRLLGPVTALNGALLVGWSTAVMFEVLRNAMRETP